MKKPNGITKTEIHKSCIGNKKGWSYSVYFGCTFPNLIGALYTTKNKANEALNKYLNTGKIEFYGDAE